MSKYSIQARNQILNLFSLTNNINEVEVKSSRLSSAIYSIHFWHRFTELLYDKNNFVKFIIHLPTNIDYNIFDKIENQIKKLTSNLGQYDRTKISYFLDPGIVENLTGYRVDGITIFTKSGETLTFETTKIID